MLRIVLCCMAVAFAAVLFLRAAREHRAGLVLSHHLHGRAGDCSLSESFHAEDLSRLQIANVRKLQAETKVIRSDGPYSLWSTPDGEFWTPSASQGDLIYDLGEQRRNIYGNGIRRGDIVLDGGANTGVFTRKALWAGASKVIAIEPAPENLECLRRTFASEIAAGRVVVYPKGIWDKDDMLQLRISPTSSASDSFVRDVPNASGTVLVPLTTVDKLVQELGLSRVDFIKMDIEGSERRAIAGAAKTIAAFHPRMALCLYHVSGDGTAIPGLVHETYPGYKTSRACFFTPERIFPEVAFFDEPDERRE